MKKKTTFEPTCRPTLSHWCSKGKNTIVHLQGEVAKFQSNIWSLCLTSVCNWRIFYLLTEKKQHPSCHNFDLLEL